MGSPVQAIPIWMRCVNRAVTSWPSGHGDGLRLIPALTADVSAHVLSAAVSFDEKTSDEGYATNRPRRMGFLFTAF